MVGTFAVVVIGKMFLHHASAQSHGTKHGGMPVGMIAKTQDEVRPHLTVNLEDVEVDVVKVAVGGSVVGVALHQHQLRVYCQDSVNCPLDIANGGGTSGEQDRLAFARHTQAGFNPGDVARTNLVGGHKGIEHVDGVKVIGG